MSLFQTDRGKALLPPIEHLQVTSSMTSPTVAAMLEVFFRAAQDVLMEITSENGRRRNGFALRFHRGLPRFKNKKIESTKFL
jgi:hypothetical protein